MKKTIFILITLFCLNIYSQEKTENNEPIVFLESIYGIAGQINDRGAFLLGGELNYQFKSNLFSIRYLIQLKSDSDILSANNQEIGLLYGKRRIYNGSSLSISGGLSLNKDLNRATIKNSKNYIGFPLEINFKWFKPKRKRYKAYGIIPIGKPTSFGRTNKSLRHGC